MEQASKKRCFKGDEVNLGLEFNEIKQGADGFYFLLDERDELSSRETISLRFVVDLVWFCINSIYYLIK